MLNILFPCTPIVAVNQRAESTMWRNVSQGPGWRTYQERLRREDRIRLFKRKLVLVGGVIGGLLAVIFSGAWMSSRLNRPVSVPPPPQQQNTQKQIPLSDGFSRKTLATLLVPFSGGNVDLTDEIVVENKGIQYKLKTTTAACSVLERSSKLLT